MKVRTLAGLLASFLLIAQSAIALAAPNIRVTSDAGSSRKPRLALDNQGNAVVVWEDNRLGTYQIFWQKFSQMGAPLTSPVQVTNSSLPSVRADIWCDVSGNSDIVWQEDESINQGTVKFCRLDALGNKTILETTIMTFSINPRISGLSTGDFDITWQHVGPTDQQIYYARYNASGSQVCLPKPFPNGTLPDLNKTPAITSVSNGTARLMWADIRPNEFYTRDLQVATVDNSCPTGFGELVADPAAINPTIDNNSSFAFYVFEKTGDIYNWTTSAYKISTGSGTSTHPAVGADASDGYLAWQDTRDGNSEIYFCRFWGSTNRTGDIRLTSDPGSSVYPDIVVDKANTGDWVIVWQDNRDGNDEIYLTSKALIGSCLPSGTIDVAEISQGATVTSYSSILSGGQPNDAIGGTGSCYGGGCETGTFIFGPGDPDQWFVIQLGAAYPLHEITSTQSGGTGDREVWDLLEILTRNGTGPWISWGYLPGDYNIPGTVTFTKDPPVMATEIKCRYGRYSPDWGGGSRVYEISALATVDHPPSVTAVASVNGTEGLPLEVLVTASDPDCEPLASLTASGTAREAGASFTAGAGNTTGILSWTPTYGQAGSYSVTFMASNALSGSITTSITIAPAFQIVSASFDRPQYTAGDAAMLTVTLQSQTYSGTVDINPRVCPRTGLSSSLGVVPVSLSPGGTASFTFVWTTPSVVRQIIVDVTVTATGQGCSTGRIVLGATVVNGLTPEIIQAGQQQIQTCGSTSQACQQSLYDMALGTLPFVGTALGVSGTASDACLAAQYWNSGRHAQSALMWFVTGVDVLGEGFSFVSDVACFTGVGCAFKLVDLAPDAVAGAVTCFTSQFDNVSPSQSRFLQLRAGALASGEDSLMRWLPDSLETAFEASGHSLANLAVSSGSSRLRVEADSSFVTADSIGILNALVLQVGSRPIQCAAIQPGPTRPYREGSNPTDAVTLRLEASTRDTCRITLFHRGGDGTVTRYIYGPALLEAGGTATLNTSRDSTSFSFAVDQNGDGVADWMLYPGDYVTGVGPSGVPKPQLILAAARPNPFGGQTTLRFSLAQEGSATLSIYDVQGRRLRHWDWAKLSPGSHRVGWDGKTDDGQPIGSGVLFYRLDANGRTLNQKMVHVR